MGEVGAKTEFRRADGRGPEGHLAGNLRDALDLHYLLTAWAATPLDEQITFAWALRQLHEHPVLDASSLSPEAGWARDEVIQIVPSELSTEDMMRIWDALDPSYRLSATYVARYVRLDPDAPEEFRPVVARRLAFATEDRS